MEQEVRYCTTEDGVRIAYTVEGEGPPLLFVHYIYQFSLSHIVPYYDQALREIAGGYSLVRYDMRGTGLSQRDLDDTSFNGTVKDIEAVINILGLKRLTVLGAAAGGPRAIEIATRHADRVGGLILYASFARLLDVFPRQVPEAFAMLSSQNWHLATRTMADIAARSHDEEVGLQWAKLTEESTTGEMMARLIQSQIDMDVSPLLPQVKCPALVCHSPKDPLWPFALGRNLAETIPNARLFAFEGDSGGPFTESEPAIDAMRAFLAEVTSTPEVVEDQKVRPLTARETEILRLIAAGRTSKEISQQLSLSIRTVGRHITNIYNKINARGRADATAYALRSGLLQE